MEAALIEKKKKKHDIVDGAQLACLVRVHQLLAEGKMEHFAKVRMARLKRNAPDKAAAWERSYGISQEMVRMRL